MPWRLGVAGSDAERMTNPNTATMRAIRQATHDFLRSLGADEAIDYRTVDITEAVKDIDVVLDSVSLDAAARARSLAVLRPGGTLVSILPVPIDPDELADIAERGIRFEILLVEADRAGMQAIAHLVETGALRAHIEATFPLPEAAKAHALGETGRTTGKIVLTLEETGKAQIAAQALRAVFDGATRPSSTATYGRTTSSTTRLPPTAPRP
jgi:NADPH:quinone reductase-like Zn-dependent oxidoreductase